MTLLQVAVGVFFAAVASTTQLNKGLFLLQAPFSSGLYKFKHAGCELESLVVRYPVGALVQFKNLYQSILAWGRWVFLSYFPS